ncbi:3-oxoacyl-ACP reductase [Paenibacillus cymbidii]|uniref:3-oxoacyl-ACP reductase n=1 Tax=Paenibacillus cymbidii TaxID=1639034 RepID=UPI001F346162|nr:3-oxoacyl-ACP reductase [Paenibacillus cymbidii]
MALNIDYANGMADHDPRFKVAVIDKAYRSLDGMAWIEGYIYGKDFPDVVATIRYYNGLAAEYNWSEYQFGASLEMDAAVQDAVDMEDLLDVIEFCGTGAAILFAEAAAFKQTSFAARNQKEDENDMKPEELKALQDSIKSVTEGMTTITAGMQTLTTKIGTIETDVAGIKAGNAQQEQKTELQLAQERAQKAEEKLAALEAANKEPKRKTVAAGETLSKFGKAGVSSETEDGTEYASFCAAVDKMGLDTTESIGLKLKARRQLAEKEAN